MRTLFPTLIVIAISLAAAGCVSHDLRPVTVDGEYHDDAWFPLGDDEAPDGEVRVSLSEGRREEDGVAVEGFAVELDVTNDGEGAAEVDLASLWLEDAFGRGDAGDRPAADEEPIWSVSGGSAAATSVFFDLPAGWSSTEELDEVYLTFLYRYRGQVVEAFVPYHRVRALGAVSAGFAAVLHGIAFDFGHFDDDHHGWTHRRHDDPPHRHERADWRRRQRTEFKKRYAQAVAAKEAARERASSGSSSGHAGAGTSSRRSSSGRSRYSSRGPRVSSRGARAGGASRSRAPSLGAQRR